MKMLNKLEPLYKRWTHPEIQNDPVADHLSRILCAVMLFLLPGLTFLIWFYLKIEYHHGAISLLVFAGASIILIFGLRYIANFDWLFHFIMFGNVVVAIILCAGDGGLSSPLASLFIIVIWLGFYYNIRKGIAWAVIMLIVASIMFILQLKGIWITESFPSAHKTVILSLVMIYYFCYCAFVFGASKFNELRLIKKLDESRKLLERNEKMASLGQLTAGIAHEINNPINFINGSAEALELDFKDLQIVLDKLIVLEKNPEEKLRTELLADLKEMDLTALRAEMKAMIQNLKNGSLRITEIVKGMESYTYQSSNTFEKRNIQEVLNDALVILSNKLKEKGIEVVKKYNLKEKIPCLPGKLNQVFVNIIDNAIAALSTSGKLEITTGVENKQAMIQFKDNGKGMESKIQRKVFDPFFTTKPIGEGTGLGMAISYGIIKDHNGSIRIDSSPNTGTEITILLPLESKS